MCYTGLFKRIIPFVLAFAAGLFIASFFVSVAAPNFSNWRESRRSRHREKQELRMEINDLRDELRNVKRENEMLKRQVTENADMQSWVPPVEIEHPPKRPKHPRHD